MEIMDYDHPGWDEFISWLSWEIKECDHTYKTAIRIMGEIGNIDIESSVEFFKSKGGHCDCEIMFNVVRWNEIKEEAEKYTKLEKINSGYKAVCPFHNEKTHSFTINEDKNSFNCYGCGKKGSVDYFMHLIKKHGIKPIA